MKPLNNIFLLLSFLLIFSCKDKAAKSNLALAAIDLERGKLLLGSTEPFGDVSFALDWKYEVRETFDLAIALLHSFEYTEAEKAFVKVLDNDSECALAYWGVAMSIYHALWAPPTSDVLIKGSKLIEIAQNLPKSKFVQS
ncbi:hypothetical protein [Winogradskyella psychrotolerans]|uniref:hypothetical protein n=1 Tax=Winogradskyella psychrotolerans TaxID=1344585 RepID=UPI001C079289|nr:hypothetical protein [Winogradskyella psychrotolerans]MBU2929720.1 hypothetical protein [Winogradskyella psychrotolerans]